MSVSYPGTIKTFTQKVDSDDTVQAADFNQAYSEITSIEVECGINVAGTYTDLLARLNATELAVYQTDAGDTTIGGGYDPIDFEDVVYDPDSLVTVAGGDRWKFTAAQGGYYVVSSMVSFVADSRWLQSKITTLSVFADCAEVRVLDRLDIDVDNLTTSYSMSGSTLLYLSADSEIDVRVFCDTVHVLDDETYNHISIYRVAETT